MTVMAMAISNILITHSFFPSKLLESVDRSCKEHSWIVFFHGHNLELRDQIGAAVAQRGGQYLPYCVDRGVAKSWNEGIKIALQEGSDLIFLLNDDLFFYDGSYDRFVDFSANTDAAVALSFVTGLESGNSPYSGVTQQQGFACCCIHRRAIDKVGYFDENFTPAYYEDMDYERRLILNGFRIDLHPDTLVEHERSLTMRLDPALAAANEGIVNRNHSYYKRKWGGSPGSEEFAVPFNESIYDCFIAADQCHNPYPKRHEPASDDRDALTAHTDEQESLEAIATRNGTDKWNVHWYAQHYATHFEKMRARPVTLLEIGIGGYNLPERGGESLRAWRDYFPLGRIMGLDYYDKKFCEADRISTYQGSQADPVVIADLVRASNGGFDIIVDDGSHRGEHAIASFIMLWQYVKDGGWYVIEDLQTSYWPYYGGKVSPSDGSMTCMGFLKTLIDGLNWQEIHQPTYSPSYFETTITGVHFYHNICFLAKGQNTEGSTEVTANRINNI